MAGLAGPDSGVRLSLHLLLPCGRSVQFRTTPRDSTGVPHVLEHTVLCGSQKYPCRDPFFKMLNRSLSTFMNAFTGERVCTAGALSSGLLQSCWKWNPARVIKTSFREKVSDLFLGKIN